MTDAGAGRDDALDAFLRAHRADVPAGLVARLAAAALDPAARRRIFWADAAEAAWGALRVSAAGLLLAAGLAFAGRTDGDTRTAAVEQVAALTPAAALGDVEGALLAAAGGE